jgi:HlyD family secretion protein
MIMNMKKIKEKLHFKGIRLGFPLLSVGGICLSLVTVCYNGELVDRNSNGLQPPLRAYEQMISGAGIVEASSHNISVGSPLSGIVQSVSKKIGDAVAKGDELFRVDTRQLEAEFAIKKAALGVAETDLVSAEKLHNLLQPLISARAVSKDEYLQREIAVSKAKTRKVQALQELHGIETELERSIIRSPIEGTVLQVSIRPGERVGDSGISNPYMVVGDIRTLHVRVDLDENDAVRFQPGQHAKMFLKGDSSKSVELQFVEVEPYVIPKRSLTGDSTERIDTRVLQVVYAFNAQTFPVFVGQQVDVFIDAKRL